MIAFLIAFVALAGAVAVLNLLLTVGVIRRLREHTERLATLGSGAPPPVMLAAGQRVGEFVAATTDGAPVSRDLLSGRTLVGVFAPGCSACTEQLPRFLATAREFPGGRAQVLAVVAGESADASTYREQLDPVARVVVEAGDGPLATALQVQGFPAFGLLDADGLVVASAFTTDELPMAAPAAA